MAGVDRRMQRIFKDVGALNAEFQSAGAWVFAGGLQPPDEATVVRLQDGKVLATDGPFAEGKEHIGGFWVISPPISIPRSRGQLRPPRRVPGRSRSARSRREVRREARTDGSPASESGLAALRCGADALGEVGGSEQG